jgi:hypothetical protein
VQTRWDVQTMLKDDATKAALGCLLGTAPPALLFTASHGVGFPNGDPRQLDNQGALVCQDWPGPEEWKQPIPQDFYFAADDIGDDARLLGLIAFHFACYGGGTPRWDDFAHRTLQERTQIAPRAFVARLPQRLLSHPKGGALAVIAHIERAWGYSFMSYYKAKATQQLEDFQSTLTRLMKGQRVGWAMEFFNSRYANLSSVLTSELEEVKFGKTPDDVEIAGMWTANNDARGYAIIGDPAVRLRVSAGSNGQTTRPAIEPVHLHTAPTAPPAVPPAAGSAETTSVAMLEPGMPVTGAQPSASTTPVPARTTTLGDAAAAEAPFGVVDTLRDVPAQLNTALQQFLFKVGAVLDRTVRDVSSLEVRTYVSDNIDDVAYDPATGRFTGGAKLRAVTYIKVDGDTLVCVPEEQGEIDQALWAVHTDMVARAQANRAEMIKTAVSAAAALLETFKPG